MTSPHLPRRHLEMESPDKNKQCMQPGLTEVLPAQTRHVLSGFHRFRATVFMHQRGWHESFKSIDVTLWNSTFCSHSDKLITFSTIVYDLVVVKV